MILYHDTKITIYSLDKISLRYVHHAHQRIQHMLD